MGKEDFFLFAIGTLIVLIILWMLYIKGGYHELMITMPSEMQRFITVDDIKDQKLINPED